MNKLSDKKLTIKCLGWQYVRQMHKAFVEAFSDYPLDLSVSETEFIRKYIEKLSIHFPLSIGAFDQKNQLIGFVFSSIATYKGVLTAYNGGTGVIPQYRGSHITKKMYVYLITLLKKHNVKQCVLEVLTTNHRAAKSYEKIGFMDSNYFRCFKLQDKLPVMDNNPKIKTTHSKDVDWKLFDQFSDTETSFVDIPEVLSKNLKNESLVIASFENKIIGYGIYQKSGRLSRIGVDKKFRRQGVGRQIINHIHEAIGKKPITVLNVSDSSKSILQFFEKLGFENQVDQREMTLML